MHQIEMAGHAIASRRDQAVAATRVTQTAPRPSALARRLAGNEHDAGDVLRDSYLRAWRSLDRFRGEARATWLHAIVTDAARSFPRQQLRAGNEPAGEEILAHPGPHLAARADTTVSPAEVTGIIAGLPPSLRSVLLLKDLHGLSPDGVALGPAVTPTAPKVRVHRAHRRLRADLGPRLRASRGALGPASPGQQVSPAALAAPLDTRRTAS